MTDAPWFETVWRGLHRWQDVLDVLLVAFVFYRLLMLVRGTRAFQMLIGLAVLLSALVISKWLGLNTVEWLVTSFWSQIVLALVILFHPEIRRTLARIGQNPFGRTLAEMEESRAIEEIIKAAVGLSNRKIGGIFVLEREIALSDIVEMGTPLDAKVSKELLLSIFAPRSPMHDGAVIVSEDRIVAAGCFLPLSMNPNISKMLGTRHRAALGVTEDTDAVVVVVSEETGAISVVTGGKMTRELDAASLRRVLMRIFVREKKIRGDRPTRILRWIRQLFPARTGT